MNAHHRAGEKIMKDGELRPHGLLPDLGYYRCDVTRQWPVNGQKVRCSASCTGSISGSYEAVLYSIKPNITAQQVLQNALPKMDKVLAESKFSKPLYEQAAKAFVDRYRASAAPGGRGGNLGHAVGWRPTTSAAGFGPDAPGSGLHDRARVPDSRGADLYPPRGHDRHH